MFYTFSKKLTKNEEYLMDLFWKLDRPLTSVDLYEYTKEWKNGYLHNLLRSLVEKGMLTTVGTVQYGRQYARQFIPALTKARYAAKLVLAMGFEEEEVSGIIKALLEEVSEGGVSRMIEEFEKTVTYMRQKTE